MMTATEVGKLNVGDRVGFGYRHTDLIMYPGFGVIVSRNKRGEIKLDNGRWFNARGNEIRAPYSRDYLWDAKVLELELRQQEARLKRIKALRDLKDYLHGLRDVRKQDKEKILQLVKAIVPAQEDE